MTDTSDAVKARKAKNVSRRLYRIACSSAANRINILEAENDALRRERDAAEARLAEAREEAVDWMSFHHRPLCLTREEDGMWTVWDASDATVWGSGGTPSDALASARAALAAMEEKDDD